MGSEGAVVVTGGAGDGIGSALSGAIAEAGWTVIVADRDESAASRTAAALCERRLAAVGVYLDVSDEDSVAHVFDHVVPSTGVLRGLVNSAGVGMVKRLADVSAVEWDRVHGVDLRGAFLCSRAAIPLLIASG